MQELKFDQIKDANGGFIPFIIAGVAIDGVLIGTMGLLSMAMSRK
jgi:lactobin A/cerein 7B family class IIb bacteriocin